MRKDLLYAQAALCYLNCVHFTVSRIQQIGFITERLIIKSRKEKKRQTYPKERVHL